MDPLKPEKKLTIIKGDVCGKYETEGNFFDTQLRVLSNTTNVENILIVLSNLPEEKVRYLTTQHDLLQKNFVKNGEKSSSGTLIATKGKGIRITGTKELKNFKFPSLLQSDPQVISCSIASENKGGDEFNFSATTFNLDKFDQQSPRRSGIPFNKRMQYLFQKNNGIDATGKLQVLSQIIDRSKAEDESGNHLLIGNTFAYQGYPLISESIKRNVELGNVGLKKTRLSTLQSTLATFAASDPYLPNSKGRIVDQIKKREAEKEGLKVDPQKLYTPETAQLIFMLEKRGYTIPQADGLYPANASLLGGRHREPQVAYSGFSDTKVEVQHRIPDGRFSNLTAHTFDFNKKNS